MQDDSRVMVERKTRRVIIGCCLEKTVQGDNRTPSVLLPHKHSMEMTPKHHFQGVLLLLFFYTTTCNQMDGGVGYSMTRHNNGKKKKLDRGSLV